MAIHFDLVGTRAIVTGGTRVRAIVRASSACFFTTGAAFDMSGGRATS